MIIGVSIFSMVGCNTPEETAVEVEANQPVNYVSVDDLEKRIENGDTFAFVIGSASCPACQVLIDNLDTLYEEKGVKLDYIDLDTEVVSEMEREKFAEFYFGTLGQDINSGLSTPTTYFIIDGKLKGEPVVGAVPADMIVEVYEEGFKSIEEVDENAETTEEGESAENDEAADDEEIEDIDMSEEDGFDVETIE